MVTVGLPICEDCERTMRVGATSKDSKTQVVHCTKCGKTVVRDTTKEKEALKDG